jgi:hypothetical protein
MTQPQPKLEITHRSINLNDDPNKPLFTVYLTSHSVGNNEEICKLRVPLALHNIP